MTTTQAITAGDNRVSAGLTGDAGKKKVKTESSTLTFLLLLGSMVKVFANLRLLMKKFEHTQSCRVKLNLLHMLKSSQPWTP